MSAKKRAPHPQAHDINASQRGQEALDLRVKGLEWEEIAQKTGYGSRGSAFKAAYKILDRHESESAERYRRILSRRMDKLHTVYFDFALGERAYTDRDGKQRTAPPNIEAAQICLQIYDRMIRIHGLEVKPDPLVAQNPVKRVYEVIR